MSEEAGVGSVPAPEAMTVSETGATTAEPITETAGAVTASAGALLRRAREAAGVELQDLAQALKVSVKKLEALEADRFDQLPDAVFVRALASSVCRALKIDTASVLALLPQSKSGLRPDYDETGLNTPFNTPADIAKTPFLDRLSRPMVLAALAVLLGAIVLIFFPSTEQRAEIGAIVTRTPSAQPAVAEAPVAQTPSVLAAPVPPAVPAVAPAEVAKRAPLAAEPALPVLASVPAPVPAPAPVVIPAPVKPVVAAAPQPAAAQAPDENPAPRKKLSSTGTVVFKTRETSWIEVTDANGAIQLSREIEPGEPVGASGPLPLHVTVGRSDVTEVMVRGKPFPLDELSRGGVARFEVK